MTHERAREIARRIIERHARPMDRVAGLFDGIEADIADALLLVADEDREERKEASCTSKA